MKNLMILLGMLLVLSGMMKLHEKTKGQYSKSFKNINLNKKGELDDKNLIPTGVIKP